MSTADTWTNTDGAVDRNWSEVAKSMLVCTRGARASSLVVERVRRACERIRPDNLAADATRVWQSMGLALGVHDPSHSVLRGDGFLAVGNVLSGCSGGWTTDGPTPDGSYALFRFDDQAVELLTDCVGMRTIWYVHDEENFIASTSQRAIVHFLGAHEANSSVTPWMLSSGSLGPEAAWDPRIRRVPPNFRVVLDRRTWKVSETGDEWEFTEAEQSEEQITAGLLEALRDTVSRLDFNWDTWVLPLSGGGDSRALMALLSDGGATECGLRTVTWGLSRNRERSGNDAEVARRVAAYYSVPNTYYPTDRSEEPLEVILDRFLLAGEGRVDHLSGYMDGLKLWETMVRDDVQGTIRGDQGFGLHAVASERDVRLKARMILMSDVANLDRYAHLTWPEQKIPAELERQPAETLASWRDRLSFTYRIPTILAGLSDIKVSYLEQASPLLSRRVLQQVVKMPDDLRTDKRAFTTVSRSIGPSIPLADAGANATPAVILGHPDFEALLLDALSSDVARSLVPAPFLLDVIHGIQRTSRRRGSSEKLKRRVARWLPAGTRASLRDHVALPSVDWRIIGFRVYIVVRMQAILREDAAAGDLLE